MPALRLQRRDGQEGLFLREQHLSLCHLDRQQVPRRQAHPPEQVPGRPAPARRSDTYRRGLPAKRDAYYPADLILKDDGERVISLAGLLAEASLKEYMC